MVFIWLQGIKWLTIIFTTLKQSLLSNDFAFQGHAHQVKIKIQEQNSMKHE